MSKEAILKQIREEGLEPSLELERMIDRALGKEVRYGLVWEDHPEPIYEKLKTGDHLIEEFKDKELKTDESDQVNYLFEGDNLQTLMLLKEQGVKVDVIYIDPPYNIGADVRYGDKFYDKDDEFAHSKWLSFMEKRLRLARDVMADDAVIFVSIDDGEQAQLKLLMDKIYGEENFISNMIWRKGGGKSDSKFLANRKEYVLIYRKSNSLNGFKGRPSDPSNYRYSDSKGKYSRRGFAMRGLRYHKTLDFPIEAPDGSYIYPGGSREAYQKRMEGEHAERDWCWTLSRSEYERRKAENEIEFVKQKDGSYKVYYKSYIEGKTTPYEDIYSDVTNSSSSREFQSIFDKEAEFSYTKPKELVSFLIGLHPKDNLLVLDFFAGSGTTGQAVMELNKEDGGNRRFVLATNNEVKESDAFDLWIENNELEGLEYTAAGAIRNTASNNKLIKEFMGSEEFKEFYESDEVQSKGICREVTYERVRRVAEGDYASGKEVEPLPINLKYYKLDVDNVKQSKNELMAEVYKRQVVGAMINNNLEVVEEEEGYTLLKNKEEYHIVVAAAALNKDIKEVVRKYEIKQSSVYSLCNLHEDMYFIRGENDE